MTDVLKSWVANEQLLASDLDSNFNYLEPTRLLLGTAGENLTAGNAVYVLPKPLAEVTLDSNVGSNQDTGVGGSFTMSPAPVVANNSNRILIVTTQVMNNNVFLQPSGVTVNGNPMTLLNSGNGSNSYSWSKSWYMLAPPTGTLTVVVSGSNNMSTNWFALSYYNVQQVAPTNQLSLASSTPNATSTFTANVTGALVVVVQDGGGNNGVNSTLANNVISNGTNARKSQSALQYPPVLLSVNTQYSSSNGMSFFWTQLNPILVGATAGIYKASAGSSASSDAFIGFANASVSAGDPITVITGGIYAGLSSLVIGTRYYLSDTLGAISSSVGSVTRKVGIAVETTKLLITNIW